MLPPRSRPGDCTGRMETSASDRGRARRVQIKARRRVDSMERVGEEAQRRDGPPQPAESSSWFHPARGARGKRKGPRGFPRGPRVAEVELVDDAQAQAVDVRDRVLALLAVLEGERDPETVELVPLVVQGAGDVLDAAGRVL